MDATAAIDWRDEDLVLISALEHWSYCPRQCALIHLEQTYDENIYTMRGKRAHDRVHGESSTMEDGIRVSRGVPLWSDALGLYGKSDLIEWRDSGPYPVEYKIGKKRKWDHEVIQLCAQAMCLEEMLRVPVTMGAVYYITSKRRREIRFGDDDRETVRQLTRDVREMLAHDRLPLAINDARCPNCSLIDACTPQVASHPGSIRAHFRMLFDPAEEA